MNRTAAEMVPAPVLQMFVRVSDGSYESRLEMPVTATKEQINNIAQMWISALAQAIQITRISDSENAEEKPGQ